MGKCDANRKERELLRYCGIDRKISLYDEKKHDNVFLPLCDTASNKICRAIHEDLMSKVQVNLYVSGLHKIGSQSIHRYTKLEMGDLFALTSVAFGQPLYKVDRELNIIEE